MYEVIETMSQYQHPQQDVLFLFRSVVGFDDLLAAEQFADLSEDLVIAILEEAGKFGSELLAPLNAEGDRLGSTLNAEGVQQAQGFSEAYAAFVAGGWPTLNFPAQYGGQGLPNVLSTAVNEIWQASNMAFGLCPMLTQGAVAALLHHGSPELAELWLPKLVSGEWTGTMNLTEPDAGSDLAAVKCRAVPNDGHYLITGQKIFITWGDHQMTDNIVHLVLARLPDAPAGVKGISLFLVPKYVLDETGNPSQRNDVVCASIEHKLGIHASPTCTMSFGEQGGAVGYLVGEANQGLMAMFTMMNHARQAVGVQGLGISERAYQQAVAYAKERVQGTAKDGSKIAIIEYPDVRRMLLTMKSLTEAMRGLALLAAAEQDKTQVAKDPIKHQARNDLYTPIVKGWLTEIAQEITALNVQIHGGMGFIEETGAAQLVRDARILTIYEGTTGIQALDLVGRKLIRDRGMSMYDLLSEVAAEVEALQASNALNKVAVQLQTALEQMQKATDQLLGHGAKDDPTPAGLSYDYLMLAGVVLGGWILAGSARCAEAELANSAGNDTDFLRSKVITAQFYCDHILPRACTFSASIDSGVASITALPTNLF